MSNTKTKTYMLVPHHDFPADGPVVLGSIIPDPLDPGDSLNEGERVEIPPESRHTTHKYDWEHTIESLKDGRVGVWARWMNMLGLGGNFGANFDTKTVDHYRFQTLETTYFSPSPDYVKEAVKKTAVRLFVEGTSYKSPIYMITGLKTVRGLGAKVTSKRSTGYEGSANFGISGMMPASPFALDAGDVTLRHEGWEDTSFRGSSDFVIGYRLIRITFKKNAEQVHVPEHQKHTVGAMLGVKNGPGRETRYSIIAARAEFGGDEVIADELCNQSFATAFDEADDNECKCFAVPSKKGVKLKNT
jgi:hypothetical protein